MDTFRLQTARFSTTNILNVCEKTDSLYKLFSFSIRLGQI